MPEPAGQPQPAEPHASGPSPIAVVGAVAAALIVGVLLLSSIENPNRGATRSAKLEQESRRAQIEQSIQRDEPAAHAVRSRRSP